MPADPTNQLLHRAVREALRPMGLTQKGRSRTWLDHHAWWLIVVEFQPSGFAKGSYLNVGINWLWKPRHTAGVHSFDHGYRVQGFWDFQTPEQWEPVTKMLADEAAKQVRTYRHRVPDLPTAAELAHQEAQDNERGRSGWPAWHAGIANGVVGNTERATTYFRLVADSADDRDWWLPVKAQAERWCELVAENPGNFVDEVRDMVEHNRNLLRLPPLQGAEHG